MDGGGSIQSSERAAEKLMDDYLKSKGLHRKRIAKDGSCLFRAVAEQVLHCQSHHTAVRAKCVEFLKENRELYEAFVEGDFEDYLSKLQDPQQWVGEVEINALAIMYKRDFLIYQEPGKPAVNITDNNFRDKVQLCFLNGNHYDSVYPISHVKNTAVCQSILYELLYDRVFNVDQGLLGLCQRVPRPTDVLSDDSMAFCGSSEDSDPDTGEAIWGESETTTKHSKGTHTHGRGRRGPQLPERVRRSLNPTLYRNIEYDVWHKTKKAQQKMDYCIAAGMQFAAGDPCQVRLNGTGRSYSATVKEVPPDNGPVTVLIEELGKKQVPLWNLRPANEESSWRTVGGRDKKLSNGHGEWEERGKGRGRGKHIARSFSVPQVATGGSSGRGQKHHVWSSQPPIEEQGVGKPNRRSTNSAEPAFGLTEEQRLAREEEEINVALVEIQLRDENSFPALGTQPRAQNEAGRRKGAEKQKPLRNKTTPAEVNRVPSPSEDKPPKSRSPPLADPPTAATGPSSPSVAAADAAAEAAAEPPPTSASTAAKAKPFSHAKAAAPRPAPAATAQGGAATTGPNPSTSSPSSAPTFIAPVAPSPTSFLPPASLPRRSPTPPSLHRPLSPHPSYSSSSSVLTPPSPSAVRHAARVHEVLPVAAQSPTDAGASTQATKPDLSPQGPVQPLVEPCSQAVCVPQDQPASPQTQSSVHGSLLPHMQYEPHPTPEVKAAPQVHPPAPAGQAPAAPSQPDVAPVQDCPSASADVFPPAPPHQPPHPSHLPPPSFPPPVGPDDPHSQNSSEASPPPAQPQPESPAPPALQPQQPHPSQHPLLPTMLPPYSSIPGGVPLHQMSQLYQDPLYPGFPQGEKGGVAVTPPYSSNKSGDDMPQDINILRFFFNLGIKAYSMPMFAPYIYLFPLQHAHTLQAHSQSAAPSYPPSTAPARPQELYPPPHYPPAPPMPPQYEQPAAAESSQVGEVYSQPAYPVADAPPPRASGPTHAWEQHQIPPPPSSSFPVGYPTPNQPYPHPRPFPQGYHPVPGLQQYPPGAPPYAPASLGYQSPPAREEPQVNQGAPEQQQPLPPPPSSTNEDSSPLVHGTVASKMANMGSSRTVVFPGYSVKMDSRENLTGAVLLVDPPLNNTPILVSNSGVQDVPISRTTMNPNSTPGSPLPYDIMSKTPALADNDLSHGYRGHQKMLVPANTYPSAGTTEPGQVAYLASMVEPMSVGCSTEEDWEEKDFKPAPTHYRGPRRTFRVGGRWRGSHDSGRGANRRRHGGGDAVAGMNFYHFSPAPRGRGRERGY